jgi:opacity protein-like surface antigen
MSRNSFGALFCLAVALLAPQGIAAQGVSFEVRGGAALPLGILVDHGGEAGDAPGVSFGGGLGLAVLPNAVIAGGFSQHRFGCEPRCELSGSGFEIGVRGELPIGLPASPWMYAGVLFHELRLRELDRNAATVRFITESSPGFQLGGGVAIALARGIALSPGVRYSRYQVTSMLADELGTARGEREHQLQYLAVEIGARFTPTP